MLKDFKKKSEPYVSLIVLGLAVLLFLSVLRASIFSSVPEEKRVWFELAFLLLAAVSAELLLVYLKQPQVMVLLLVGVLVSPSAVALLYPLLATVFSWVGLGFSGVAPHLVASEGVITVFAQLGAILLLFKVGLHSEVRQIFNFKNFVVALFGVVLPFFGGYLYAVWSGHGIGYAIFLGAALTATSVGVTVAVLDELKLMKKQFARIILGAAVIDDVLALLVLSFVNNLPSSLDAASLAPLASVLVAAAVFLVGGMKLGEFIVKKYFDKALQAEKISRKAFLGILAFVLAYAYVAEFIGLSAIVGAFIAGIALNYSRLTQKLFDLFYPLEAFFTPLFFISLGLLIDLPALFANLWPVFVITLIAIATKLVGCGLAARICGAGLKDSASVGIGMIPRGEIALIVALYGLTAVTSSGAPALTATEYSIIASMAFLTTVFAPLFLQKALAWQETKAA